MLRNNPYIDLGSRPHTYIRNKTGGDSLPNAANQNNSFLDVADSDSDHFFFCHCHVFMCPLSLICFARLPWMVL